MPNSSEWFEDHYPQKKPSLLYDKHLISEENVVGDDGVVYTVKHFRMGLPGHGLDWHHVVTVWQGSMLRWGSIKFTQRWHAAMCYAESLGVIPELGSQMLRQNQLSGIDRSVEKKYLGVGSLPPQLGDPSPQFKGLMKQVSDDEKKTTQSSSVIVKDRKKPTRKPRFTFFD